MGAGRDFCVERWDAVPHSEVTYEWTQRTRTTSSGRRRAASSREGRIDRREFLTRSLVAGLGLAGVGAVAKSGMRPAFAADRPLTPTFYQWIQDLHPGIPAVNAKFPGLNYQIAPVEGFGIERFVAEAKNKESTWDVYVGQTPFVEMSAFDQGRRHRTLGQLHPEGRDRRHHPLDPRGVHGRRQTV